MGLELLETGADYLIVRSTETKTMYAVRLGMNKEGETVEAAPLESLLSRAPAVGPGDGPVKVSKPGATVDRRKPGETREIVLRALREAGGEMTTAQLAEATGENRSVVLSAAKVMTERGLLVSRKELRPDGSNLEHNLYRLPGPDDVKLTDKEREIYEALLLGPGSVADINERRGRDRSDTDAHRVVKKLESVGLIGHREETNPLAPYGAKHRVFYANEPIGETSSQRPSEPDQGSS